MKKKIPHLLIAGGTGFIGYHLANKAKKKRWKVTSISLTKPKLYRKVKGVKYILLDVTKKSLIKNKLRKNYNYVVNLSGVTNDLYSKKNKKKIYNSHVLGSKNLIDFFLLKNIEKFIQIGSSAEYGNAKSPQRESIVCKPKNTYGRAKLKATKYLLTISKKNKFKGTVMRFFQVYGPGQGSERATMQILSNCYKNKIFPASDGKQIRDFCYIDDVTEAIFKSFDNKKIIGKILNIGYGRGIVFRHFILSIRNLVRGGHPQFGLFKSRSHENPKLVPDIKKAKKLLNWKPKTKLMLGLKKTLDYLKVYEK